MDQTPWLDELALAVADGRPIDWQAQDARIAADIDPDLIAPFRLVERIVRAHRETTFDIELESVTVGPAGDPMALGDEPNSAAVTWGPLTIAERIGGGSYGDVFRAHDRRLDRTVALKLLRRRDSAQTRRASAVIEEARLMARVRHPNVVMVHGAERIDGRVGLWMEYLEGQTLADELRIGGPFSEEAVIEVGRALCGALAAVHAAGLLHHDLKAQNVIRTTDGRIVLTDFGAGSQVMTDADTAGGRQLRGTPAYLAPEILSGQPASLQSEVYSLGVLLYYLATGMFPDRTASSDDIRHQLSEGAALSASLSSLISRCLAPNPSDRFKAMPEVAAAVNPMTDSTTRTQRFVRALKTKAWLWLVPTLIGFGGAALWSARTPYLYRSSALIAVVPPKVPTGYLPEGAVVPIPVATRIPAIRNQILSRSRLERIIQDLDLYAIERRTGIMEDIVGKMRSAIEVFPVDGQAITVGFTAADPRSAQRVADRLSALFMDESAKDRKLQIENTDQYLETQLKDLKARLEDAAARLSRARGGSSSREAPAEALELEVAQEGYKKTLTQQQQVQAAANLERREIGEQFRQIDPARLPARPLGPSRGLVKLIATLVGLAVGLILVAVSSARVQRPPMVQPESV